MTDLNWPPLSERRARIKLTTLYKARSGAIEIPMDDLIPANHNTNIVTRTNSQRFYIPDSRVDTHPTPSTLTQSGCGTNFHSKPNPAKLLQDLNNH